MSICVGPCACASMRVLPYALLELYRGFSRGPEGLKRKLKSDLKRELRRELQRKIKTLTRK